jgi:hypothetical protein
VVSARICSNVLWDTYPRCARYFSTRFILYVVCGCYVIYRTGLQIFAFIKF